MDMLLNDGHQMELAWFDEDRDFLLKRTCPNCGGIVFLHHEVDPINKRVTWTIACGRTPACIHTNPVQDRSLAFDQWNMLRALLS
jgi:ribosomal protein S27AE